MSDVGAPAPEVYRLSMEKLPLAKGRARRIAVVQALAVVTALEAAIALALRGTGRSTDVTLVVWGLAVVGLPYFVWTAGVRVRRRWNAFELSIGPHRLRCAARGHGRVTISLAEIASVTEGASGLVVRSSEPGVVVSIPRTVEGFLDVRARLARQRPIAARADALWWSVALAASGLVAAATVSLWGRSGCVAAGVLATQASAVFAAAVEVRWHPRLAQAGKLGSLCALAVAAALPVLAFAFRELSAP